MTANRDLDLSALYASLSTTQCVQNAVEIEAMDTIDLRWDADRGIVDRIGYKWMANTMLVAHNMVHNPTTKTCSVSMSGTGIFSPIIINSSNHLSISDGDRLCV